MRVLSREATALAFDAGTTGPKGRVVIESGYNTVSDTAAEFLASDPNYQRCVKEGYIVENPEGDAEAADAAERFETVEPVVDPRAKLDGEKPADYKKRMATLDAADKPRADFLETWHQTDEAAQAAAYPTLTDEQRVWVDADKAGA